MEFAGRAILQNLTGRELENLNLLGDPFGHGRNLHQRCHDEQKGELVVTQSADGIEARHRAPRLTGDRRSRTSNPNESSPKSLAGSRGARIGDRE
jgi:hypothetical protein